MKFVKKLFYFGIAWLYIVVAGALLGYMVASCWDRPNNKFVMILISVFWPFVYPFAFLCDWLDIDVGWESYGI